MKKFIESLVQRSIFGNLLTVGILLAGILVLLTMRREAFPRIDFDIVVVSAVFPGASPKEVETLVTIPIERELKGVDGFKETSSTSLESRGSVVITLDPDVEDKLQTVQDIRDAVDRAKVDFPDDVEEPVVTELSTSRTPVIEIALSSKLKDEKPLISEMKLRDLAERLEKKLELLPEAASIERRGYREREIFVEVFPERLLRYNISIDEIASKLASHNLNFPGGTIIEDGREYTIRTVEEFQRAEEIRDLSLRVNDLGGEIKIKDIAYVRDDLEERELLEKANGSEAIILTVLKREKGDAITLVDDVRDVLAEFKAEAPPDLQIAEINDISYYIRRRLNVLINNVTIGLALVLASLLFFLGWRVSLMVALGIPFSFALSFMIMGYLDLSINLISMFGLIIVAGMVVDDAIVVGENIYRHIEKGQKPVKAAVAGSSEMIAPVTASISTTIVAFAPLLFMSGIMGKFIWSLPAAVIIALAASLFESFFILPGHIADITRNSDIKKILKKENSFEMKIFRFLLSVYRPTLETALKYRYGVLLLVMIVFAGAIALIPQTGFILFPKGGIETFYLKAEAQQGVSLDEMNRRIRPLEKAVAALPSDEIDDFVSRIGIHQEQANDPFTKRGNHYAQIAVYLTPLSERERDAGQIINYLKNKIDPDQPVYFAGIFNNNGRREYVVVRNRSRVAFYSNDNFKKPARLLDLKGDYLSGAGLAGNTLYTLSGSGILSAVNLTENKIIRTMKLDIPDGESIVSFTIQSLETEDGVYYRALVPVDSGRLLGLDLETGEFSEIADTGGEITVMTQGSGRQLFIGTDSGRIIAYRAGLTFEKLWQITEDAVLIKEEGRSVFSERFRDFLPRVEALYFSPGNSSLYAAFLDGTVRRIGLPAGEDAQPAIEERFIINDRPIHYLRVDGSNFYISQRDNLIRYNAAEKKVIYNRSITGYIQQSFDTRDGFLAFGAGELVLRVENGRMRILNKGYREIEKIEFKQAGGGPPVGAPVQIEVRGEDFAILREIAEIVKEKLYSINGVYDIRDNWEEGKEEFHVVIDERRASMAGISVSQIATTLQAAFEGRVATSIKKADEEIDIRVIFPENLREKLSSLNKVMIRNSIGNLVPITALAGFEKHPGVSLITHKDNRRTIYVKANINESKNSSVQVNTEILDLMRPVMQKYPEYNLVGGGEYEDTQESMQDLGTSALIALLSIAGILVLLFGNLRQPRVIMSAIPLGMVGVSIAFYLHKVSVQPDLVFSFLATMGVIGLTGVVVNDSIVLVDFINRLRRSGMNLHDAVVGAGIFRLRAVILTTVTTVFGLLPTAYGIGGNDPFLRPMALAMAWGLGFATVTTLVVIPVYYTVWEERGFVFRRLLEARFKNRSLLKNNNEG